MDHKKYLIILGAGPQQIPAYKTAKDMGIKTVALDYNPEAEGIKFADRFINASVKDKKDCLTELKKADLDYLGVITLGVEVSPIVAAIAKEFDLIAVSEETAYKTTNKCARSSALREKRIPIPDFEIIENENLPNMKFPFVIKPSDNSGSRGVRIVESEEQWKEAYNEAKKFSGDERVIVEELLFGGEISIEGFVLNKEMIITGFSERKYIKDEKYRPYFMEDGSTAPTSFSPETIKEAEEVFANAAKSLGVTVGPSKGDLIVTKEGVKVLEITSRLSSGFSRLIPLMTGADPLKATIKWAIGEDVEKEMLEPKFNKAMAHRYYFHKPGRVKKVTGLEELKNQPGVHDVMILRYPKIGEFLKPVSYMNRLVYIYTIAENREKAIRLAEEALSTVKIEVE